MAGHARAVCVARNPGSPDILLPGVIWNVGTSGIIRISASLLSWLPYDRVDKVLESPRGLLLGPALDRSNDFFD